MIQLPMSAWARRDVDFAGSLYRERCPECGAEPFTWCQGVDGKRKIVPHAARRGALVPEKSDRRGPRLGVNR